MESIGRKNIGYSLLAFGIILVVLLAFVKADTEKQGAFLCKIVEESPNMSMEDCPGHESITSWLILSAFFLAFLVIASGIYILFLPVKEALKKADISKLTDEEKKIYSILKGKEGSMYQSELIDELGFSKVKITRLLDKMEGKGLIDRKRRGMTNIIILK